MATSDYYQTLGVSRDVDAGTLKSAYRKAAMKWHPDRNPGDAEAEADAQSDTNNCTNFVAIKSIPSP